MEVRESEMQPAFNSILEASEAGLHHCCVSYDTVGTQTDEPMDLSEKKFQELYFVVYICLLFIFAPLSIQYCKVTTFILALNQ